MWVSLVLIFILAICISVFMLFRFINPIQKLRKEWYVVVLAFVGWFLAFFVPLLLPIDLASSFNYKDSFFYNNTTVLVIIWWVIYAVQFVLCYLVFPIVQTYTCVGDFTFLKKLKRSIKRNVIFYGILIILMIIFFVLYYVFFKGDNIFASASDYVSFGLVLSNAWGLILAILLMGNGIVLFSYNTIKTFTFEMNLKQTICDLGQSAIRLQEQKMVINDKMGVICGFDKNVSPDDGLRRYVDQCVEDVRKCDTVIYEKVFPVDIKITYDNLAMANEALQDSLRKTTREQVLYDLAIKKAERLFLIKNEKEMPQLTQKVPKVMYYYYKYGRYFTNCLKLVLIVLFWVFVLAPEETMVGAMKAINPLCQLSKHLIDNNLYTTFALEAVCVLMMMTFFAFSSFVNIEMISFFRITDHQLSDSYSILFAGNYLSRVGPALALNFIHMVNFTQSTAFLQVNGGMENVPFFGRKSFNDLLPMCLFIVIVVSILFLFIDYRKIFNIVVGVLNTIFHCVDGIGIDEIVYVSEDEAFEKGTILVKKELMELSNDIDDKDLKRTYRKSVLLLKASKSPEGYHELESEPI
ncbi:hypothetical protein EIN_379580 [Entamoeba invadens IP1]|uniref:LMBR1 domain containing protein n=1 Tax=Entamoeba invadens IP1 TaxID=370355 RepID=A0A0A1UE81_ENTIV|nr:hypothetical protein EIN_379580 [Entamoeba invadens IP1]ELP92081.1 hypothetical protein EIN_379580 [Entamoeba invadens IP1]|eukprot:XP_004258852.1 hypothetical protein EIN_379580 [Entamoeba invadens IP1]